MIHINFKFIFFASGIFFFYFVFGILQEKIFKSTYGDGEKFSFVITLIFLQTVVSYFYTLLIGTREKTPKEDGTPTFYYAFIALTYLLAMASSTTALQWVSYPAQVIAKASKPIPVMIMGVLIGHKVFPARKYFIIILIVAGVTMFMYKGNKASADKTGGVGVGELLLICSLAMDGIINSLQERIMFLYSPTSNRMMMKTSQWSTLYLGVGIFLTGEIFKFISFIQRYPSLVWEITGICFTGTFGSYFIYQTITEFGTLTCSLVTTTRKFFSVLGSVIIFGNALTGTQWLAVACVFTGLFLDVYYGKSSKRTK